MTTNDTGAGKAKKNDIKDAPYYAVPLIVSMLMLSAGGMYVLIALGSSIFASINY